MDELALHLDGHRHYGWQTVSITRSMERAPFDFELTLTNRWRESQHRRIRAGMACKVWLDDDLVIDGFTDEIQPEYDAENQSLIVAGRSRLADLVDCSTAAKTYTEQTLDAIARDVCKPFGIEVVVNADVGAAFKKLTKDEGQSPWEFLEYASRMRAVRLMGDAQGRLVITGPGQRLAETPLILGENVRRASGNFSFRNRYSDYLVYATSGEVFGSAADTSHPQARSRDTQVRRYRPMTIVSDADAQSADCKTQADWHRNTAYGRSQTVVYTVRGWREKPGGPIWMPNTRVKVRDEYAGVEGERILVEARLILDDKGRTSELLVMPKEALSIEPLPEPDAEAFW